MAKFGLDQVGNVTPRWAKNLFLIYFISSKPFIAWIATAAIFSAPVERQITLLITLLLDPILYAISKMVGIDPAISQEAVERASEEIKKEEYHEK